MTYRARIFSPPACEISLTELIAGEKLFPFIYARTYSGLLWDTVRVITRLVEDLNDLLPAGVEGFTKRTRSARRRMQEIHRMSSRPRQQRLVRRKESSHQLLLGAVDRGDG
jgi:hypothetical protein